MQTPILDSTLLAALADRNNEEAWSRFDAYCRPLLHSFHRCWIGQDADADDLTQQTMLKVNGAIGRFVCQSGQESFHAWLFCIARRVQIDHHRAAARRGRVIGDPLSLLELAPASGEAERRREEQEHSQHVVHRALRRVRRRFPSATWTAFWRTAIDGERAAVVASELGLSLIAVYRARWKVQGALRALLNRLEADCG